MAVLLIRYSEIGLKGISVRNRWENRMKENLVQMFTADGVEAFVTRGKARFYVEASDLDKAIRSARKVFGVASISIAEHCSSDQEELCAKAAEYSKSRMVKGKTFAVRARREGSHKYTSMEAARFVGDAIWNANLDKDPQVNLSKPDLTFWVEVKDKDAYIFQDYIYCHAGLPIGTQGHVTADIYNDRGILSAWLMMKRGCKVYVRGDYDASILQEYDPGIRFIGKDDIMPRNLGFIKGCSLEEIPDFDPTAYDLPVFFPTVGMTDEEVEQQMKVIREEAAESPRKELQA